MESYERVSEPGGVRARKGGGHLDWETGRFEMLLATEGEASDGHILSMRGAELPERIPLLVQHSPQPMLPALGSVIEMKARGKKLPAVGWVELSGASRGARAEAESQSAAREDALEPIRRGYAHMIDTGHLSAVSVRWTGDGVPRSSLKPTHAAYIDQTDESRPMQERYGLFFPTWRPQEGSVVAVGADPMATIREQADHEEDPVARVYWQALVRAHEADQDTPDILAASALIQQASGILRDAGLERQDLELALANFAGLDPAPLDFAVVPVTLGDGRVEHISREAHDTLTGESLDRYREAMRLTVIGREAPAPREPAPTPKPQGDPRIEPAPQPPALDFSEDGLAALARGFGTVAKTALRGTLRSL